MVSGIIPNGEHFAHYGYLGDMETGPYIAYGLECEDPEYLKSQHGRSVHRATDVTERNLMQMFQEIQTGEPYEHIQCNELLLGRYFICLSYTPYYNKSFQELLLPHFNQ